MTTLQLDPSKTALVVIDMTKGVMALSGAPYTSEVVLTQTLRLAEVFRGSNAFVVLVKVDSKDGKDMLHPVVDAPMRFSGNRPADAAMIVPELGPQGLDHVLVKHQWGAFHGTDLDLQLRRRGIDTIVLCGVATNFGVETTAREAYQHGYQLVFAEDAMTALSAEEHQHTLRYIFPRIGRIRTTEEIIAALG